MKKTKKVFIRYVAIVLLIQTLILWFFIGMISMYRPNNLKHTTIKVEEFIETRRTIRNSSKLIVFTDSEKYHFTPTEGIKNFKKAIDNKEEIDITYIEDRTLIFKRKFIVDARTDSDIIYTYDQYKKEFSIIVPIILFIIAELMFLFFAWLSFPLCKFDRKYLFKNKKKKKAKNVSS